MKTKIFALFAAMMLLVGTTAMAQSGDTKTSRTTETEIKGDVNNDGVVDVADIAAVIAVMHEQGTVETQYYWYAGWTEPTEANIGEIINEEYPSAKGSTTMNPAGLTSTKLDGQEINFTTNPIYDQVGRDTGNKKYYYVVVPNGYGIQNTTTGTFSHIYTSTFEVVGTFANHTVYKNIQATTYIIQGYKLCEVK